MANPKAVKIISFECEFELVYTSIPIRRINIVAFIL